jgi:protocatechuate 3,4-dioxygenase alpha subunit
VSESSRLVATPSQTVGPFFHFGLAETRGAIGPLDGDRIDLSIHVTDGDGVPVNDAMLELWQMPRVNPAATRHLASDQQTPCAFGRVATGADGACEFETVRPSATVDRDGTPHAAHINVFLFARGLLRHLQTRIYFDGDPDLDRDPVLALVPVDRRRTLLAVRDAGGPARWRFDLRLQGANETVFFDA